MEMPKPAAEHSKLHALAGQWKGEETIHPMPWDPAGGKGTSDTTSKMILEGFFLACDYVQRRNGIVTYQGVGLFGYDANKKKYTMYWVDTMGGGAESLSLGDWKEESRSLVFQHKHTMGHSRYTFRFPAERRYEMKIETSQDGKKWATFLEGRYQPA